MNNLINYQEAQRLVAQHAPALATEIVDLDNCFGRIISDPIISDRDYPPFNRSAVDGYACNIDSFVNENRKLKVVGQILAGDTFSQTVLLGDAVRIMTGAAAPLSTNVVIKVEDTLINEDTIFIKENVKIRLNQNIALKGEDLVYNTSIITDSRRCSHEIWGLLATLGKKQVCVFKQPKIALFTTGNEIKAPEETVNDFQIRNSNKYNLLGLLKKQQIHPLVVQHIADDEVALKKQIQSVLDFDYIILTGGVSMGVADYIPKVLKSLAIEQLFHKVALKPGKPIWVGKTPLGGMVFGLPGNPLSAQICFKLFFEHALQSSYKLSAITPIRLPIQHDRKNNIGLDVFFPCFLTPDATLVEQDLNGSGDIRACLFTQGFALHNAKKESIKNGDTCDFYYW